MKLIKIWTLLATSVDARQRGKFGRLGHFIRHHGQSGRPVRHKLPSNNHSLGNQQLQWGLKWPKKTVNRNKVAKQSLQDKAQHLLCLTVICTPCITYYDFDENGNGAMKTECPKTTTTSPDIKENITREICCEQKV